MRLPWPRSVRKKSEDEDGHVPYDMQAVSTAETQNALARLAAYHPPSEPGVVAQIPAYRRAAVLVGLFIGRKGALHVILSQRSTSLRSHAGDTALPGGRCELLDRSLEETARREALEECGLPMDSTKVQKLCQMRPFLSANELLVTPVVFLITDPMIQPRLNPKEVERIFSLPLEAFLFHDPPPELRQAIHLPQFPKLDSVAPTSTSRPSDWHSCRDARWLGLLIRRHYFMDTRNPVMGLTSDILIHAAMLAYDVIPPDVLVLPNGAPNLDSPRGKRVLDFSLRAPGQPASDDQLITLAFSSPRRAKRKRVRPRFAMLPLPPLPQPMDDQEHLGLDQDQDQDQGGSESSISPDEQPLTPSTTINTFIRDMSQPWPTAASSPQAEGQDPVRTSKL